ncbi:site-specific integrase (plasmid) [Halopseudomonas sp. SMJS2]|uniref:tyrosine-type recombinase/integrase n=1 Tax=Halopseudomonas sp. SMJS2 TaxID=3041098 RepID=UPI0024532E84|nr:site-specific integrase [Halopseudomonas sp. SMJS2]WGK63557.1 site-specific integrase [Halopseudomonas sp. SMJS2]
MMSRPRANAALPPQPLFDTYETFIESTVAEYAADHPEIARYIQSFEPGIAAGEDYKHVRAFLNSYNSVKTTFNGYRTHVERLLLWSWIFAGKSVLTLRRSDIESFMAFSAAPHPTWVANKISKRFVVSGGTLAANPEWRPFTVKVSKSSRKLGSEEGSMTSSLPYSMSQGSVRQVFAVCSSFYDFLIHEGLSMEANPCRAIKQKGKFIKRNMKVDSSKSLTRLQWDYVVDVAENMANEDPDKYERSLFILVTLQSMYLRVSDLVGNVHWTPTMGSFVKKGEFWWYQVIGKGNVEAEITVKPDYLQYLTRYRRSRGLSDLPSAREQSPLITSRWGRGGLTDRQVRNLIQEVFDKAVKQMQDEGRTEDELVNLREASLHWLRHTGATFDAPFRDPKHLQADLRHKALATTQNVYYNAIDDERAAGVANLKVRD